MARRIFLSSVMLAIVLVGLVGCSPTSKEKPESETTVEQTDAVATEEAATEDETAEIKEEEIKVLEARKKELESQRDELQSQLKAAESEAEVTPEQPKATEPKVTEPNATEPEGPGPAEMTEKSQENEAVDQPAEEPMLAEEEVVEVVEEPKVDLGLPLVDNLDKCVPLLKNKAAWVNREDKQVIMVGQVSQRNAPLEMFVCQKNTKEHESVLSVDTTAAAIHAALLLIGAEPGHPVQYQPEYKVATGTPIAIDVIWKDADGKIQKAKAQEWIKNVKTGKAMAHDWVFAGSGFWENKETGQRMYLAEQGDFICVSNFPTAMLDLPIKSSDKESALLFQAWEEHVPPLGTPVTIVLKPILDKEKEVEKETTKE